MDLLLLAIGIASVVGIVWFIRDRSRDAARDALIVWGALGPFDSGTQSARAMTAASQAVMRKKPSEKLRRSFDEHKSAFEESPEEWADSQRQAAAAVERKHKPLIKKAQMILAEDAFNDLFGDLGYQANFTTNAEGQPSMGIIQTKTDEQIAKEREESDRTIAMISGRALKSKNTVAGKALCTFVESLAQTRDDFLTEEELALGSVYLELLAFSSNDETLKDDGANLVRTFTTLLIEDDLEFNTENGWRTFPGNRELLFKKLKESRLINRKGRITDDTIREARMRDAEDYWNLKEKHLQFLESLENIDFKSASTADIYDLRAQIFDLIVEMHHLGRPTKVMLANAEKAYSSILRLLVDKAGDDLAELQVVKAAIEEDEASRQLFSTELSNLLKHFPSEIRKEDFSALLLKSEIEEFRIFLNDNNFQSFIEQVRPILGDMLFNASSNPVIADEIPNLEQKVSLLKRVE